jgi:4-amino-4-deoxy-L-arabinose transferase-like glycosyltransferase
MPIHPQRLRWLMLALVTLFSLYMNVTAVRNTEIDQLIRGDSRDYLAYVFNLFLHGVYAGVDPEELPPEPDAVRAPGYILFIYPLLDLAQDDFSVPSALYAQTLISALTTFVSMLIFRRIMPFTAGIVCGMMVAISPHLINANVYLLTESLFTFLLITHVYALIRAKEKDSLPLYCLSGLLLAASWLVRPTTMLLPFAYIMFFGLAIFRAKLNWRAIACLVVPFFIAYSGWSARNVIATGEMSDPLLTKQFIHHGSYINLMYQDRPDTYGYPYMHDTAKVETVDDAIDLTIEHFKENPARFVWWTLIGKPIQLFRWDLTESVGDGFIFKPLASPYFSDRLFIVSQAISRALHIPLMVLAVMGCAYFLITGTSFTLQVSSLIVLYFIGFHMLGAPFPRYSLPIRPFCYGLALAMVFEVYSFARRLMALQVEKLAA